MVYVYAQVRTFTEKHSYTTLLCITSVYREDGGKLVNKSFLKKILRMYDSIHAWTCLFIACYMQFIMGTGESQRFVKCQNS